MTQIRTRLLCLLLAAGLPAAAGIAPSRAAAVIGGERVTSAEAPWAASLTSVLRGRRGHHCSATVIGPRRLATARHCVERSDMWKQVVVTGTDDPERQAGSLTRVKRVWAARVVDHGDTRTSVGDSDLAIVETAGDLKAPALPLTAPGAAPAAGEPVHAYGFGYTDGDDDGRSGPSLLRRARLTLYTAAQCAESSLVAEAALCAGRAAGPGGGSLSNGDSGGGLVRQGPGGPELLGVSSAIPYGPQAGHLNSFASVPELHAFATAPERGVELPMPRGRARLSGRARVGARLRCAGTLRPQPKLREVRWALTPRSGRYRVYKTDGAWRVPRAARGGSLICAVFGGHSEEYGSQSEWSRPVRVRR